MYFDQQIGSLSARQTIQQGSTSVDVVDWQRIIGVTADGIFGPQTKAATVAWQKSHGVAADGIVGPLTWAAADKPPKSHLLIGAALAAGACFLIWKAVT